MDRNTFKLRLADADDRRLAALQLFMIRRRDEKRPTRERAYMALEQASCELAALCERAELRNPAERHLRIAFATFNALSEKA